MRVSLIINGKQFGDYIKQGGVSFSYETRNEKSIVAKDGTKYMNDIKKHVLNVNLLDRLFDEYYTELVAYLSPNPATVSFTNFDTGEAYTGSFFVSDVSKQAEEAFDDFTIITGASFILTEK